MSVIGTYERLSAGECAEMLSAKRLWAAQQEKDLRQTLEVIALLEARLSDLRDGKDEFEAF